jgi:signal transduction histidine kinase
MPQENSNKVSLKVAIAGLFSLLFLLTIVVSVIIYQREIQNETKIFKTRESEKIRLIKEHTIKNFNSIVQDLLVTSSHQALKEFVSKSDSKDKARLEKELLSLSSIKKIYDQIRYLDKSGKEIIRVNYNNGKPLLVSEEKLQNKGKRYYFADTFKLNPYEVFVSPLDLNIEQGKIEQPIKPMIRIGTPLANKDGEKQGILLVNYLASELLNTFKNHNIQQDSKLYLTNKKGYWLKGPSPEGEWGFMYDDKHDKTIQQENKHIGETIIKTDSLQKVEKDGLYTTETIYPFLLAQASSEGSIEAFSPSLESLNPNEYSWKIISFVPKQSLVANAIKIKNILIALNTFLLALFISVYFLLARIINKREKAEQQILKLNNILKLTNKILRHDLANIFTRIKQGYELFKEEPDEKLLTESFGKAEEGIDLIHQMKELEQLVTAKGDLQKQNLVPLLEKLKDDYKIEINIKGEGSVMADQALESVFKNLINNAITHGKTKKIDIQITKDKRETTIEVIDYGLGVPDEIKEKIFEEGFKYGETGNTGIGLYIVEQTISRYDGRIKVKNNQPKGAIFEIILSSN